MKKTDFHKPSKIPCLETTGMPTRVLLKKPYFMCYHCSKMAVGETYLVKKSIKSLVLSSIRLLFKKMIEKTSMIDIAHQLFISTIFKTLLKDQEKIVNALQLPYSNAKLEASKNLIKLY